MRFRLALAAILLSVACTPRAEIVFQPGADAVARALPVFVATTRGSDGPLGFGDDRSTTPRYARFDITIPTVRETGSVTYPGNDTPDPTKHFLASRSEGYADPADFQAALRDAFSQGGGPRREALIFVHGFNNTFAEGVLRLAQLTRDFDLKGVAVHYSWPSAGNPLGYVYDRDSALFARDGLEQLIRDVEASGARSIVIVAHSMGSLVTMEALRQLAIAKPGSVADRINGVILISPDIDVELFRSQTARIGELPSPFGIFVSQRDRALALSARLTGQRDRLGSVRSVQEVSDLDVTIIDITQFSSGLGHSTALSSPTLIQFFSKADDFDTAFRGDSAGQVGLLSGTVLTVQNATEIILSPVTELSRVVQQ